MLIANVAASYVAVMPTISGSMSLLGTLVCFLMASDILQLKADETEVLFIASDSKASKVTL